MIPFASQRGHGQDLASHLQNAHDTRTVAGRFVAGRMGSAVQHIAFETQDIFATVENLTALGFERLPIPSNYYDDAVARHGLTDDERTRLEMHNILCDEVDGQRFYQLYSKPYGDGFFFEIVQRNEGYDGYGAANAPFRTAALRRVLGNAA